MQDTPTNFAEGVNLFVIDDCGVVFSETAQEIYQLNTTATFVWCQIENGVQPSDLLEEFAETFQFDLQEAEAHLAGLLDRWRNLGLLSGASQRSKIRKPLPNTSSRNDPPALSIEITPQQPTSEQSYEVLGQRIRVELASAELKDWIYPALSHLEVSFETDKPDETTISVWSNDSGFVIAQDGRPLFKCTSPDRVTPYVLYQVFIPSIMKAGYDAAFHAGAVSDGRRAVVIAGEAGSGKTCLTLALVHAGYQYHSDDLVLLYGQAIQGVPFSPCVKESGQELLGAYFPEIYDLPTHVRPDGQRVRYLPPSRGSSRPKRVENLPVRWLIFPRYVPDSTTCLERIPRGDAIQRLMSGGAFPSPLKQDQFDIFVHWLRNITCFELTTNSLSESVEILKRLWRRD